MNVDYQINIIIGEMTISEFSKVKIYTNDGEVLIGYINEGDRGAILLERKGHYEDVGKIGEIIYSSNIKNIEVLENE